MSEYISVEYFAKVLLTRSMQVHKLFKHVDSYYDCPHYPCLSDRASIAAALPTATQASWEAAR